MPSSGERVDSDQFTPIPVGELELSTGFATVQANARGQICLLVRVHGVPLGVLSLLEPSQNPPLDLCDLAADTFADPLTEHLVDDGLQWAQARLRTAAARQVNCASAPLPSSRLTSVVVCTLGEDPRLVKTVESILAQSHTEIELVVIDNNPESGRARAQLAEISDSRMRIVPEPRRGLSAARNTGLRVAAGSVIAYTDDDAYADAEWISRLIAPFDEHDEIACVTGLVVPAELATREQVWFERFGAFDKGFERTVWTATAPRADVELLGRLGRGGALFPYSPGVFGSGNNMAFRTDWLRRQKLFDEALGAGTVARGGEDLDAFLAVMLSDAILVYEPRAIVKHYARSDTIALRKQMYGYGSGLSAVIAKQFFRSPQSAGRILSRVPKGLRKLLDPASEKNVGKTGDFPKDLSRAELAGFAAGPLLYLRSRLKSRRRRLARRNLRQVPGGHSEQSLPAR